MNHVVTAKTQVKLGCYFAKECWWLLRRELCKLCCVWQFFELLNIATPQPQASVAWIRDLPLSSGPFPVLSLLILLISQGQAKYNLPLEPSSVPPGGMSHSIIWVLESLLPPTKESVSLCLCCSGLGVGEVLCTLHGLSAEQLLLMSHHIGLPL